MNYKTTMVEMKEQLMHTFEQDEGYKIVNLLTDEIMKSQVNKEIKKQVDIIRR